jgi:quercetin dioxygenase-like cupin family protein
MSKLVGFGKFADLPEEQISEKISRRVLSGDQGMMVWWSIEAGVHVEPHSHANEQIVWMLKGRMEFRLGGEQRLCGPGDVVVIPRGEEHEAWFRENTEVIDFFAPPREDFLVGGRPTHERRLITTPARGELCAWGRRTDIFCTILLRSSCVASESAERSPQSLFMPWLTQSQRRSQRIARSTLRAPNARTSSALSI